MHFDGQVAIITGGAQGLGRSYAQLLAAHGAHVVVNDLGTAVDGVGGGSSSTTAEQVAAAIRESGGQAVSDASSVADPDGARAIVDTALKAFGRLDIVINNAGILISGPFTDVSPDQVRRLFEVHVLGSFLVTQAAWPHLVRAGYGRIVLTTSGVVNGYADLSAYSAMKGATQVLARTLALEGAPHGIRVNAISPSAWSRMAMEFRKGVVPPNANDRSPDSVAPVVAYLAHSSCERTGATLVAAGGQVAAKCSCATGRLSGTDHGVWAFPPRSRPQDGRRRARATGTRGRSPL